MSGKMHTDNKFIRIIEQNLHIDPDHPNKYFIDSKEVLTIAKKRYDLDIETNQAHEIEWERALKIVKEHTNISEVL